MVKWVWPKKIDPYINALGMVFILVLLAFVGFIQLLQKGISFDFLGWLTLLILWITVFLSYARFIVDIEERRNIRTLDLFKLIEKEEYREARRYLISKLRYKSYEYWIDGEKWMAEKAITNYDIAGMYYRNELIDKELLIKNWAHSTILCWKAAEDVIIAQRCEYKHSVHPDFEYLYYAALAFYYEDKFLCKLYEVGRIDEKEMRAYVENMIEDEDRSKKFHADVLTKLFFQSLKGRKLVGSDSPQYYLNKAGMKKAKESNCKKKRFLYSYEEVDCYLFSWEKVPGDESNRLLQFLTRNLDIGWAENAEIEKSDDGKTIGIKKDENSAEIIIDEENEKATLRISDDRSYDLKVKTEQEKQNLYFSSNLF